MQWGFHCILFVYNKVTWEIYFVFCRPVNVIGGVIGAGEVDDGTEPGASLRRRRSVRQRVYRQADLNSKGSNINSSYINILNVSDLCDAYISLLRR